MQTRGYAHIYTCLVLSVYFMIRPHLHDPVIHLMMINLMVLGIYLMNAISAYVKLGVESIYYVHYPADDILSRLHTFATV